MFLYKVGFVHPIFGSARHQHDTWTPDLSKTRDAQVFLRHFRHLAMPYWWALRRAKQLSTAATLLCWSSISVVLMSYRVKSFYVVRSALLLCLSSTHIQIDKFNESASARKKHIFSPNHHRPAKPSSNNPLIICQKKSRNQKLNIIILYCF